MVRVVSGSAGGLRLKTKDSDTTRATLEKVKEAMFDMIMNYVYGAEVLDLFSGNGSLGIEALSRGAAHCVFNDKDRECVGIIRENVTHTHFEGNSEVMMNDYSECISKLYTKGRKFDIILLDPPYKKGFIVPAIELASKKDIVSERCTVVAEIDSEEEMPEEIGCFTLYKRKKYGNSSVLIYRNF